MTDTARRYTLGHDKRLHGGPAFARVYNAKARKNAGPLSVLALPNDRDHPRLGLSVSRKVGTAVKRNRIKRLLREAFRLMQYEWSRGFDVVIVVRPHEARPLEDYQRLLAEAMRDLETLWRRRERQKQREHEATRPGKDRAAEGIDTARGEA